MITVKKEFVGIEKKDIPENFTIILSSNGDHAYELKGGDQPQNIVLEKSNNGLVWTWRISDAAEGTYTVSEENTAVNGFELKSRDITGSFTIKEASYQIDSELITPNNEQVFNIGGDFIFAAALTGNLGTVVITPNQLSVEQQNRINAHILINYPGNWNGNGFYFHDISSKGNEFSITKNNGQQLKITYNAGAATMTINHKSDWSHVAKLTYAEIPAVNAEIIIVNTYAFVIPDPSEPTTPDPTTPDPTTPDPSEPSIPDPTTPDPTTPDPTTPDPTTPDPTTPDPSEPSIPDPTIPDPSEPSTPDPTTPEPTDLPSTESPSTAQPTTEEQVAPHIPPVILAEKLVKEENFFNAGDKLHYSFIVKNDGIVPVVKLTVNDSLLGIEDLVINLTEDPLMLGDSYTYEFSGGLMQ